MLQSAVNKSRVDNLAVLFCCTFETSRCHFDLRLSLQNQTLLNKCWPVFLLCKTSYVVGSSECLQGRSVYALELFLIEGLIGANCRNYFPHTSGGLANAHWCSAAVMKNDVVILLAELVLDWKIH